ncbi:hypothetical protein [Catellatospora citrea]|uniref:Uncharacterized protein n=1 Tax=Catellatospora citrea TaxID=53366 RepID=A0A8J3KCF5_9ACTN|nr:hypothetical protein [Catellatospora citrea]RKE11967.1 hypothetical protein C8E86_6901 [Catellatospora citrea]GIG00398.1 hypothetical protein Cci01nite_54910 [Catellatospora citrea]
MLEQWRTIADLDAARQRFEAAIPGWRPPAAFGVARLVSGRPVFARVAVGDGFLPAVVLASVCGHSGGSASYPLTPAALDRVIALLTPAVACTELPHPNLHAWRGLRQQLSLGEHALAAFAGDLSLPSDDPHVTAMLEQAAVTR